VTLAFDLDEATARIGADPCDRSLFAMLGRQRAHEITIQRINRLFLFCTPRMPVTIRQGYYHLGVYGLIAKTEIGYGMTVEEERIDALHATKAKARFLSLEPLLGPIGPDWVIVGRESGMDYRPMDVEWARSLRDACAASGTRRAGHRAQPQALFVTCPVMAVLAVALPARRPSTSNPPRCRRANSSSKDRRSSARSGDRLRQATAGSGRLARDAPALTPNPKRMNRHE
jgi:hypothetical protein